jgi:hypothetical protein
MHHYLVVFTATGAVQYWTVPSGVFSITAQMCGAQGGSSSGQSQGSIAGGLGASLITTLSVTPGSVLTIIVGTQGTSAGVSFHCAYVNVVLATKFNCLLKYFCVGVSTTLL